MNPHEFWQELHPPKTFQPAREFSDSYPVTIADGRQLLLPVRPLADGNGALASLIINQASFDVVDALAEDVANSLSAFRPEIIVGLPTLGLTLASAVARALGHHRYVALGTSRKFWYREELSVPLSSITTPAQQKRLYIDPRMPPLLADKRVVLVDDVISTGSSIASGLNLLAGCGVEPVAIAAAMLQTERWRQTLATVAPCWPGRVVGAFSTPLLQRSDKGDWIAD
ncbi:phosphoribosyltransferase [Rhizobiaceae bacterium n13]|uniref:Phosphoribosyltransferase n=1 Tax=Ferirhizobium litorale TaxID=2927786 RepID=A0AAE3QBE9_9HYPH|nr:phosphoribosyltransferase [Fererhizobium litorale]MDI7861892.1 phosphoribosyltransferase [Fererhizobium litorale]MDI7921766.1 phosphoribosyltransferase [Fererhizobium litorale]